MGFTFKENCPDVRNTRVIDIYKELQNFDLEVEIYDPYADKEQVKKEYGVNIKNSLEGLGGYGGVIVAVAHDVFKEMSVDIIKNLCAENSVIFDVKSIYPRSQVDGRL